MTLHDLRYIYLVVMMRLLSLSIMFVISWYLHIHDQNLSVSCKIFLIHATQICTKLKSQIHSLMNCLWRWQEESVDNHLISSSSDFSRSSGIYYWIILTLLNISACLDITFINKLWWWKNFLLRFNLNIKLFVGNRKD